jgi:hypothetical protein
MSKNVFLCQLSGWTERNNKILVKIFRVVAFILTLHCVVVQAEETFTRANNFLHSDSPQFTSNTEVMGLC